MHAARTPGFTRFRLVALVLLAAACARPRGTTPGGAPLPAPALAADSARGGAVVPGVVQRTFHLGRLPGATADDTVPGPWAVHVLQADRRQCWSPRAIKGASGAAGRRGTSALVAGEAAARPRAVAGGVNADFFSFAPDGMPQAAHVAGGRVVAGPAPRPVVALDSAGALHVVTLSMRGTLATGGDTLALTAWNRTDAGGVALFDPAFGPRVDSARASGAVTLRAARDRWVVARVDSTRADAPAIPETGRLLLVGRDVAPALRARLLALRAAVDTVDVAVALAPFHPREAVGGQGVLLRGGEIPARVDSVGGAGFARTRHPRTAVGWAPDGRLLLVVVDGRQPGYSAGMTLRELARTMRALGAIEALNLDGGGSSTLVVATPDSSITGLPYRMRIVNRPSDRGIERPVANALALVRECMP